MTAQHVFIARPIHHNAEPAHERAFRRFLHQATVRGYAVSEIDFEGDSLVQRVRNRLTHIGLQVPMTDLVWWDSDIVCEPESIFAMLERDEDVVCISYPKKTLHLRGVREYGRLHEPDPIEGGMEFVLQHTPLNEESENLHFVNGALPVKFAGTGLMRIKRHVLTEMAYAYPSTLHMRGDGGYVNGEPMFAWFDCMIHDREYLSEDYLFCKRWRDMGGIVWCLPDHDVQHIGKFHYRGNAYRWLAEPMYDSSESGLPEEASTDYAAIMLERYEWGAENLKGTGRIADACCGPGYGMQILRKTGAEVIGFDRDEKNQAICRERGFGDFVLASDIQEFRFDGFDALCTLETLEHLPDPIGWLQRLSPSVKRLVASAPCVPTKHRNRYHLHDFTYDEILRILQALGWTVKAHKRQRDDVVMTYAERA